MRNFENTPAVFKRRVQLDIDKSGSRLDAVNQDLSSLFAAESPCLPHATDHKSDPSRMVLAALAGQSANEGAIVQLLVRPAPSKARRTRGRSFPRGRTC